MELVMDGERGESQYDDGRSFSDSRDDSSYCSGRTTVISNVVSSITNTIGDNTVQESRTYESDIYSHSNSADVRRALNRMVNSCGLSDATARMGLSNPTEESELSLGPSGIFNCFDEAESFYDNRIIPRKSNAISATKIKDLEPTKERNYDTNPTELFQHIVDKQFDAAQSMFCEKNTGPQSLVSVAEQANTWVYRKERGGKVRWRMLPLHAALFFKAPLNLVQSLIFFSRVSLRCADDREQLPLHLAFRGKDKEIIIEIIKAYPDAFYARDYKGRIPIQCAENVDASFLKMFSEMVVPSNISCDKSQSSREGNPKESLIKSHSKGYCHDTDYFKLLKDFLKKKEVSKPNNPLKVTKKVKKQKGVVSPSWKHKEIVEDDSKSTDTEHTHKQILGIDKKKVTIPKKNGSHISTSEDKNIGLNARNKRGVKLPKPEPETNFISLMDTDDMSEKQYLKSQLVTSLNSYKSTLEKIDILEGDSKNIPKLQLQIKELMRELVLTGQDIKANHGGAFEKESSELISNLLVDVEHLYDKWTRKEKKYKSMKSKMTVLKQENRRIPRYRRRIKQLDNNLDSKDKALTNVLGTISSKLDTVNKQIDNQSSYWAGYDTVMRILNHFLENYKSLETYGRITEVETLSVEILSYC